ncbi:hypothetical protein CFBP8129_24240 [Xanthomonas hortorum pv. gardneri]|uniref:Uncharacterized protein n=1 Tax=Xanthomonas hortorum pv. gardneri TaxID=2754056 RepID=A0A6V7DIT0_9XANT|nr:hypothetical protein CFBP8129_24240 [Xanthomonas hortorum pv. gardneri]CAD0335190.1 hypothetical protein CFBP8129_24240 [Xanthomonas hortorum pv. gardneri]
MARSLTTPFSSTTNILEIPSPLGSKSKRRSRSRAKKRVVDCA